MNCVLEVGISTISAAFNQPDSSTANQILTSNMFGMNLNKQRSFSRAIGLFLIVFIFYGTTVEAAHRHGRLLPTPSSADCFDSPGTASNSYGTKSGCNDCLICQLHQNFTATLVADRPTGDTVYAHTFSDHLDPVAVLSRVNTPRSGRAPPQAN